MKKYITGLLLLMTGTSRTHVHNDQKQAAEAMKQRSSMLKGKLSVEHGKEKQIESGIAALKKSGRNAAQLSILMRSLSEVRQDIQKLEDALRITENSLKPLTKITK